MAKSNTIEAMGTVIDAQPNAMFKVRLDNDFETRSHLRKDQNELHSYSAGRQSKSRTVALRSDTRKNHMEGEIR